MSRPCRLNNGRVPYPWVCDIFVVAHLVCVCGRKDVVRSDVGLQAKRWSASSDISLDCTMIARRCPRCQLALDPGLSAVLK